MKAIVIPLDNNNLKEVGNTLSKLLWQLVRPDYLESDVTTHLFGRIKHPTLNLGAMLFDENYQIPFRLKDSQGVELTRVVSILQSLVDLLYPNASQTQIDNIKSFIRNNDSATVEQILPNNLPASVQLLTMAELIANGWFDE